MGRRAVIAVGLLVLGGVFAFIAVDRPFGHGLSTEQAANALDQRLGTPDRYRCSVPAGAPTPGEPHWTYACLDATNPQRSGYFVLVRGHRLAQIEPSG